MSSALAEKVILLLSPSIGDCSARLMVVESCKMVNVDMEILSRSQLKYVANNLEIILHRRFGPEEARRIKEKILAL